MNVPKVVRKLAYNNAARGIARSVGLAGLARRAYCYWAWPRDGVFDAVIAGEHFRFKIVTHDDLRSIESELVKERRMLEALFSELRPGETFYDVGSNIGLYAIPASRVVGPGGIVIAFDPDPRTEWYIEQNKKLNGVSNVRLIPCALGAEDGRFRLYQADQTLASSLLTPEAKSLAEVYVKVAAGDRLRATDGLPTPAVIKIDVEGYELAVIKGLERTLSEHSCRAVFCEIHPQFLPAGTTPSQIIETLGGLGYRQSWTQMLDGRVEYHALFVRKGNGGQLHR